MIAIPIIIVAAPVFCLNTKEMKEKIPDKIKYEDLFSSMKNLLNKKNEKIEHNKVSYE
ncbi:MAG: hypothetical protein NC833_06770 [Candidatus Omnitrophica bacterium]|nr:hypothetical protein [Candidatus Omnitrophota bacterium]